MSTRQSSRRCSRSRHFSHDILKSMLNGKLVSPPLTERKISSEDYYDTRGTWPDDGRMSQNESSLMVDGLHHNAAISCPFKSNPQTENRVRNSWLCFDQIVGSNPNQVICLWFFSHKTQESMEFAVLNTHQCMSKTQTIFVILRHKQYSLS